MREAAAAVTAAMAAAAIKFGSITAKKFLARHMMQQERTEGGRTRTALSDTTQRGKEVKKEGSKEGRWSSHPFPIRFLPTLSQPFSKFLA